MQNTSTKKGNFVRDTAALVLGNTSAQVITIALTPIITRLFSPETFGEFAIVMALASPFVAIAGLRYHEAIMLPDKEEEAEALFRLAASLVAALSLLLLAAVFVTGEHVATMVGISSNNAAMLYAVPLLVFLIAMRRVLDINLQRSRAFKRIAGATVSVAVIDRFVSISAGSLGYLSAWPLIAGRIIGLIASAVWMLGAKKYVGKVDIDSVKVVFKRYIDFAKYSWSGLVQQLDRELPVIVIGATFGPATAGLFALARRLLIEPGLLIGEALSKTFYQKAAAMHRAGESLGNLSIELVSYLLRWIIPPMAIFACVAGESFELVFGDQWLLAGVYSVYLMPMFIAGFIMQPLSRLFNVLEKQREWALFTVWNILGTVIVLAVGVYMGSPELTFMLMSILVVMLCSIRARGILTHIGVARFSIIPLVIKTLFNAFLWVLPVLLMQHYVPSEKWAKVLLAAILIIAYVSLLVVKDPRFNKRLRRKV